MKAIEINKLPSAPEGKIGWPWTGGSAPLPERMPDGSLWPKISIVTPSYNQSQFLEEAIRSVLLQNYPNLEYIIIDGGSTDGSVEIIKKYEPWLAYWVSEKDKGIYAAMQKGIGLAQGDWVFFLGSDDILIECLADVALRLRKSNCIYYGDVLFKHRNIIYGGRFDVIKITQRNICQQAIFYPRELFNQYSFNLKYKLEADWDLNLRCWGEGKYHFKYMPILISIYNDLGLSGLNGDHSFSLDRSELVMKYFGRRIKIHKIKQRIIRKIKSMINNFYLGKN